MKIPFFGKHQKEKLSSNCLRKRVPACSQWPHFRDRFDATQQISVRQGGVLLDRLAAHPHTRVQRHTVDTHANSKGGTHARTLTHAHTVQHDADTHTTLNTHTHTHPDTITRSFGQNLKDTSRKKVQVYHVAP